MWKRGSLLLWFRRFWWSGPVKCKNMQIKGKVFKYDEKTLRLRRCLLLIFLIFIPFYHPGLFLSIFCIFELCSFGLEEQCLLAKSCCACKWVSFQECSMKTENEDVKSLSRTFLTKEWLHRHGGGGFIVWALTNSSEKINQTFRRFPLKWNWRRLRLSGSVPEGSPHLQNPKTMWLKVMQNLSAADVGETREHDHKS